MFIPVAKGLCFTPNYLNSIMLFWGKSEEREAIQDCLQML